MIPLRFTAEQAQSLVRELARDTFDIVGIQPKLGDRMVERGINIRQVLTTIREGRVIDGPTKDEYGDWRVTLTKRVAGRRVHVVVSIHKREFIYAITTY